MTAMFKNSLFAVVLVAAGAAAGVYAGGARNPAQPAVKTVPPAVAARTPVAATPVGIDTKTSQMYDSLAAILEQEVEERQRLEQELGDLRATVTRLETALQTGAAPQPDRQPPRRTVRNRSGAGLEKRLVEQGLDEERAAYIARRRDELALERMYLQDRAAREGWANTPRFSQAWLATQDRIALQNELNSEEFDLYLRSTGQANRVTINNVLRTSPAEQAGFQPGDRLVSYDGQQIFSGAQLRAATRGGSTGDVVIVTVERDGQQMQLSIPRGPLGVNLGFAPTD